jgi:RimJ/RimL family protein N-acetyltransferase
MPAGRFQLRGWRSSDAEVALAAARDPEIARYSSVGVSLTTEGALRWLRARHASDRIDWVVEHDGQALGRVSLAHIESEDQVAEVGYWVLPEHRRQGVASEAVAAVESYAFDDLDIVRLFIRHEPENVASCEFANSRRYLAEGTQRGAFTRAGKRRDLHVHGLLVTDR